jgi:hypothetical protein
MEPNHRKLTLMNAKIRSYSLEVKLRILDLTFQQQQINQSAESLKHIKP